MFFISPSKPNFIPDNYVRFYCHHYIIIRSSTNMHLSLLIVPRNHSDNLSFQMHTTSFKENGNTLERFLVTPQRNTLPIKNYLLSLNTLVFFFNFLILKVCLWITSPSDISKVTTGQYSRICAKKLVFLKKRAFLNAKCHLNMFHKNLFMWTFYLLGSRMTG